MVSSLWADRRSGDDVSVYHREAPKDLIARMTPARWHCGFNEPRHAIFV
jgi:hypothetical protein